MMGNIGSSKVGPNHNELPCNNIDRYIYTYILAYDTLRLDEIIKIYVRNNMVGSKVP